MRPVIKAALLAAPMLLAAAPAVAQDKADPHAGMDHGDMDHSGMDMSGMDMSDDSKPDADASGGHVGYGAPAGTAADDTPGNAPPPPVPGDMAAEAFYPRAVLARSMAATMAEMRFTGSALVMDQFEYRAHDGKDGYGAEGLAWYGGDIDRAVAAVRAEGTWGEAPETLELSGYWRHAITPWYNLQAGVREDLGAGPDRTYAMIGIDGLAPYWLEVEAQFLLSTRGDARMRARVTHDMRITNRLILEPEAEADLSLQDMPELGIASGFEKVELSARLRYEFSGMFAPYVGVFWERKLGDTARWTRAAGERASSVSALAGVRFAF